jgi:hypothetical protein
VPRLRARAAIGIRECEFHRNRTRRSRGASNQQSGERRQSARVVRKSLHSSHPTTSHR